MTDLRSGAILALQRATHATLHALARELAGRGLNSSETNVLAVLADGRPRAVGELAVATATRPTTLTSVLDRLAGRGLVVFTSAPGAVHYQYGAAYGAHKAGMDKFAADMAVDFRPFGVSAVSIWMGVVLTERVQQIIDSGPELAYLGDIAETPEFTGHVIAALAADPDLLAVSGRTLIGAEAARQYGITDRDGRQPPSVRDLMSVEPATYHGRIRR